MASEDRKQGEEEVETPPRSSTKKKGALLGGGVVALVSTAYLLALVALPGKPSMLSFQGPFVVTLAQAQDRVQVNLSDEGGKRFLVMTLKAEFLAYEGSYADERAADPLYQAKEKDALIKVARQKSKEDLDDELGEEIFKQEVRDAIDPILFPVHVGNPARPRGKHEESGLLPGTSIERSTMRGGFFAHRIELDVPARTIRLDEGPEVSFDGTETDLLLQSQTGETIYVDLTSLEPEFRGSVQVGTFGKIKNIYFDSFLVQ